MLHFPRPTFLHFAHALAHANPQQQPDDTAFHSRSFFCFLQHFRPVTLERPKVLLPLANTPLLDYTLEWLAANAVEEVYVVCCAHAEQVEAHLERAGWLRVRRFAVHPVVSKSCLSMGDALRLLDHKDIIKTDFVLISGDVVTNLKLSAALEAHRRRRAMDKAAIMTLLMRGNVSLSLRARTGETASMAVIDPGNGRLLKYEEYPLAIAPVPSSAGTEEDGGTRSGGGGGGVSSESRPQPSAVAAPAAAGGGGNSVVVPYPGYQRRRRVVSLETALFSERDDVALRTDLMDVGIYICAPEVLMLFSDNFDYQNVRRDFVTGVLSEEELGNKLYVHEITKVRRFFFFFSLRRNNKVSFFQAPQCVRGGVNFLHACLMMRPACVCSFISHFLYVALERLALSRFRVFVCCL
jgi:translation initiation factor eIF-2B subunit epsilon